MDRIRSEIVDLVHVAEEDNRYRISSEQSIHDLVESIAQIGLITPPVLQETPGKYIIVAGFRRIAACRRLGRTIIEARVLPADSDPLDGLRFAIAENALHRRLNLAEQARAVSKISPFYEDDAVLCREARGWGLSFNPSFIAKLLQLDRLDEKFKQAAANESITLDIALKLDQLDPASADLLLNLFDHLKPTVSQQKDIFSRLIEIARLKDSTVAGVLRDTAVARVTGDPEANRRDKINALRSILKKFRYPVIGLWELQYQRMISALDFPPGLKLVPPENLEGSQFCLMLNFETLLQLQTQQQYIASLLHNPEFKRIIGKEIADQTDLY